MSAENRVRSINITSNSRLKMPLLNALSNLQNMGQGLQSLPLEVNADKVQHGDCLKTREKQTGLS